jgi:hypothetical protein
MPGLKWSLSVAILLAGSTASLAQDATFNKMFDKLECTPTSLLECGPIAVNQVQNNVPIESNHCLPISVPPDPAVYNLGGYLNGPEGDTKLWRFVLDLQNRMKIAYVVHIHTNGATCGSLRTSCYADEIKNPITFVQVSPPLLNSQLIDEFTYQDNGTTSYGTISVLQFTPLQIRFSIVTPSHVNSTENEIMEGVCSAARSRQ